MTQNSEHYLRLLHFAGKDIPKDFVEELFLSLNGFDSENSSTKKINKTSFLIMSHDDSSEFWNNILSKSKLKNM